ncbi:MAG: hypothetical protein U0M13_12875, partial [Desulfovibrio fairfieldensis]|nr:hypothetical protein [Desulfovibrio fairfieldensis]
LLAPDYDRLLGLECDKRAVALARRNAERGGLIRCRYEAGDAAALLDRLRRERRGPCWDTVRADPPRAGLAPRVLDGLLALRPQTILYISATRPPWPGTRTASRRATAWNGWRPWIFFRIRRTWNASASGGSSPEKAPPRQARACGENMRRCRMFRRKAVDAPGRL